MKSSGSPLYNIKILEEEEEKGRREVPIANYDFREKSTTFSGGSTSIMRYDPAVKKAVAPLKRQQQQVAEKAEPSEDINESAEAFIRNFRKQLVIQRLESIENYEKMLARGT